MDFSPNPDAAFAFNQMFSETAEISPVGGYAGKSHFGYAKPLHPETRDPGWHITTEVPGLKLRGSFPIHDYINDM